jgi:hypothetical protein
MIYTLPALQGTASESRASEFIIFITGAILFRGPRSKSRVEVRYDPFDAGIIYAFVENRWMGMHRGVSSRVPGTFAKEVMLAAEELRKRQQNHFQGFPVTAKKLAELLKATEITEGLLEATPPRSRGCQSALGYTGRHRRSVAPQPERP